MHSLHFKNCLITRREYRSSNSIKRFKDDRYRIVFVTIYLEHSFFPMCQCRAIFPLIL